MVQSKEMYVYLSHFCLKNDVNLERNLYGKMGFWSPGEIDSDGLDFYWVFE